MSENVAWHRKVDVAVSMIGFAIVLLPSGNSDGGVANINNVHCGQNFNGAVMARSSGAPFHDVNMIPANNQIDVNVRLACSNVVAATTVFGIAVGSELLNAPAVSQSEGYALSSDQTESCVRVPLVRTSPFLSPVGVESASVCAANGRSWNGDLATLGHVWAALPDASWTVHVIACSELNSQPYCGGTSGGSPTDAMPVTVYTGGLSTGSSIIDPGVDDDTYLAASLSSFTLHDPGADDFLEIGGIHIQLGTGKEITLLDLGIRIRYETSPSGGNQWVVYTTDGSETVLVRHDTDGDDWLVDKLIVA